MKVIFDRALISDKYGHQDGPRILHAVSLLGGDLVDVSSLQHDAERIRAKVNEFPESEPICLIGGYELLPTFHLPNPSRNKTHEEDVTVLTDAPYGAINDRIAELYVPSRPVSRLPDSQDNKNPQEFIDLLSRAVQAPTPAGFYEEAAKEFSDSADLVHQDFQGAPPVHLSPPESQGNPSVGAAIAGRGRVHFLLHGSADGSGSAVLWGRAGPGKKFIPAVSASELMKSKLEGAVVTFSSCYSTLLARREGSGDPPRAPDNQVALACLAAGAKLVFGPTAANWIDITDPVDSFGAALIARIWRHLKKGEPAAEALSSAKRDYARFAIDKHSRSELSYVRKTLLQAQCLGHPMSRL